MTHAKKKTSHVNVLKWVFGTLLVIGAIFLLAPLVYDHLQTQHEMQLARTYRKHLYPADEKRDALIRQYNANRDAEQHHRRVPYPKATIQTIVKDQRIPIGNITIPSISVNVMPIYFGDSDEVLAKGTGVMPFTSLPAPGHRVTSSVTGHTGMANRIFFDNIRYMKPGDVFYLDVFAHRLAYKMTKRVVIDPAKPDAVQHFYVKDNGNHAILMTCTPIGINDHRLLIYGKRISLKAAAATKTHPRAIFSLFNLWLYAMILLLIIVVLWWLWRWHKDRQAKRRTQEAEA